MLGNGNDRGFDLRGAAPVVLPPVQDQDLFRRCAVLDDAVHLFHALDQALDRVGVVAGLTLHLLH